MLSYEPPPEPDHEQVPGDLAEAGVYVTAHAGFDHGLVVLAMGESYWLVPSSTGYRLLVEPPALAAVRDQLARFDRESLGWPPRPVREATPVRKLELATSLLWAAVVAVAFWCQNQWPGRLEAAGSLDGQAVLDRGQWWRLGSALFLHADLGHLVSNAVSGVFVFGAVLATIGRARGWLLLAVAAVGGNLLTAVLNHPGAYRSLGASTAIFAGLGLLTGRAIRVLGQPHSQRRWRALFVPLASGLTLLGLFGAGDMHTDVGAHLAGFAVGLVLGLVALPPSNERDHLELKGDAQ